jgi:predicted nucleotidyltransferase
MKQVLYFLSLVVILHYCKSKETVTPNHPPSAYSRNEAQENSDIDLLVVLNDKQISPYKEIDFTNDLVFSYMLNYENQISIVPTTKQQFEQQESPLLLNIRKDGINP